MNDSEEQLAMRDMMPIAKGGELRAWNIEIPGVDLNYVGNDQWVLVEWDFAYRLAARFFSDMGLAWEGAQSVLAVPASATSNSAPAVMSQETRRRLMDIHRIRIALRLLYPNQLSHQRDWLTAKQLRFEKRTPFKVMISDGPAEVRKALEERLGR